MSSLSDACTAWGVKDVSKVYLPHRYLQNLPSYEEALRRLNSTVTWRQLEPYMDWFTGVKQSRLQERKANRTHEEWIKQTAVYQWWAEKADESFDFRKKHDEYLRDDVFCLYMLVIKVGYHFSARNIDIRTKCTIGSIAETIWIRKLDKALPKLQTQEQHLRWGRANRGGFCSILHSFQHSVNESEGEYMYVTDVCSLYPASSMNIVYETEAGVQKPLDPWYCAFPDPTEGWLAKDYKGVEMGWEHYDELYNMHGLIEITFDQSACKFPVFLKKMESRNGFQTLAPVMKGREYYIIPHVRYAMDYGAKIWLHKAEYCNQSHEVYTKYMTEFVKMKCDADEIYDDKAQPQSERDAALTRRTVTKLMLNSLIGRNNMSIDRKQLCLTRSMNDVIALTSDDVNYSNVLIEDIECANGWCYRASFHEPQYENQVSQFNTVPYLSAYVLGYSKMLMNTVFQFLASRGATLLYTDTDSVTFTSTREVWRDFKRLFVPLKKTLGGMDVESCEEFVKFLSIGPKKYVKIRPDGSYIFKCNGLQPKAVTHLDIRQCFQDVLNGQTAHVPFFNIQSTKSFDLKHASSTDFKKIRFVNFKGATQADGTLRWWNTEEEFARYADSVHVCGWEEHVARCLSEETAPAGVVQVPPITVAIPPSQPKNRYCPTSRKRKRDENGEFAYVYILRPKGVDGRRYDAKSYVGYTNDLEKRIRMHNLGKGAIATCGMQWEYECAFGARGAKASALRLESLLHLNIAKNPAELRRIALHEITHNDEFRDFELLECLEG
eukprot:6205819-Pleurochrysis_carterae.AAC.1